MVRVTDIKSGNLKLKNTKKVSQKVFVEFTRNYKPIQNDIVMSRVGSYGVVSYVNTTEPFCMGQNTVVIHPKYESKYLYYILSSRIVINQIELESYGSGYKSLSLKNIKELQIAFPPILTEQKSIATALSDIDELITGLEKLISKKKDIKQGAMQQLLTPPHKGGKRLPGFSGEWEKKQLKSCLTYEQPSKYIVQNSDYEGQSQTPVLTAGKSFLLGYTDEDFGVYDNLPVIIFDDFTTSSQFVNFNFKVKSSAMKMLKPVDNSVDIKFIFSLMNLINFSLGDEHKRRWIAEYSEQIIYVPKIDEQRVISSMIDDMTFELDELISKRKKYQAIKQGMMQELLTGKTRLL